MRTQTIMKTMALLLVYFFAVHTMMAQEKTEVDHSYKPLTLKLSEDGKKYIRFITWHQMWLTTNNLSNDSDFGITPSIRRSRFLAFTQISPRFLLLTHFGVNSLSDGGLNISGVQSNGPQMFLHDAWVEYKVTPDDAMYVGSGLHYWNGLSRLTNLSTLNLMTLDAPNPFFNWSQLGYTGQFARHLGVYAKGKIGKFDYRVSINDPLNNHIDGGITADQLTENRAIYNADNIYQNTKGNSLIGGYFRYNVFDAESIKLPYAVGTYLGKKKVLAIGAGFNYHANGTISLKDATNPVDMSAEDIIAELDNKTDLHNVANFAIDVFYDAPLGEGAITALGAFYSFNYGPNFVGSRAGTGTVAHLQAGYLLPRFSDLGQLQPYLAFSARTYEAFADTDRPTGTGINIGANWFMNGHHSKFTLEFRGSTRGGDPDGLLDTNQIRFQAMIFL